jgi:cytochrome P450
MVTAAREKTRIDVMSAETPLASERKIDRGEMAPGCPVHASADGVWHVQDYAEARAMLRSTETRQAGFGVEHAVKLEGRMRMPVLYRDGPEHREHRRQTAKYFTPRRVETAYASLMERLADEQCETLRRQGSADLSQLSFRLAVAVAAEVIGLTESGKGMAGRLDRFFEEKESPNRAVRAWKEIRSNANMAAFYWLDVRPAIKARRAASRDDLISHLLAEGCTGGEILGECVTFAAAGMVTTREFISVAAWHLFTDDDLRANLDPAAVGADPGALCPARPMGDGVGDAGLSFGDGPHRCPGAYIAIQETDTFLRKLFAMPGLRMVNPPKVGIRKEIASYELTDLTVAVR